MMFEKIFPKIHPEGYRFLAISGVITLILWVMSNFFGIVFGIITIWVYYFFRDPDRTIIQDDNFLVSPADGEVIKVEEVNGPKELGLENKNFKKISILELKYPTSLDKYVRQNLKDISLRLTKNSKFVNSAMEKPKFIS